MSIEINKTHVPVGHFPDKTQNIVLPQPTNNDENIISWNYESDEELVSLFFIVNQLRENEPDAKLHLVMPYIPNARLDRTYDSAEVFTLKYFAKFINQLNFTSVRVLDAHSSVSLALLDRVIQSPVDYYIKSAIYGTNPTLIFMPDEGAHKRYASMVNDRPTTFGIKHRDWKTGNILSYEIAESERVKDADILIIDDISSKGGTFYHAANALRKAGAKSVNLYITHCEETIFEGHLADDNSPIDHVYIANPLFDLKNMSPEIQERFHQVEISIEAII